VQIAVVVLASDAVADDAPVAVTLRRYADMRHPAELVLALERLIHCPWHRRTAAENAPELFGEGAGIAGVLQAHPFGKALHLALKGHPQRRGFLVVKSVFNILNF